MISKGSRVRFLAFSITYPMVMISEVNDESKCIEPEEHYGGERVPYECRVMAIDSDRVALTVLIAVLRKCEKCRYEGMNQTGPTFVVKCWN